MSIVDRDYGSVIVSYFTTVVSNNIHTGESRYRFYVYKGGLK